MTDPLLNGAEQGTMTSYDIIAPGLAAEYEMMCQHPLLRLYMADWHDQAVSFAKQLGRGASLLALGSGTSYDAEWFQAEGVSYIGIDFSMHMLRTAASMHTGLPLARNEYAQSWF